MIIVSTEKEKSNVDLKKFWLQMRFELTSFRVLDRTLYLTELLKPNGERGRNFNCLHQPYRIASGTCSIGNPPACNTKAVTYNQQRIKCRPEKNSAGMTSQALISKNSLYAFGQSEKR